MNKIFLAAALLPAVCKAFVASDVVADNSLYLKNPTAYIPSQCYTKTRDDRGGLHNPCYTCHTRSIQPNYVNDFGLQLEYALPEAALTNPWKNLFEDRRPRMAKISDDDIITYVSEDNYRKREKLLLSERLSPQAELPAAWDQNNNGRWDGYIPDCWFYFDAEGIDHAPDGHATGWIAFKYYPLPSTFWPTNGSAGNVMIRLPKPFRASSDGRENWLIYRTNLAIVEAVIQQHDVLIPPTDEKLVGTDLDLDGKLGTARRITYIWPRNNGRGIDYAGAAKGQKLAGGLYPLGTEFLHSVRYLQEKSDNSIGAAPRMKELRYMVKRTWRTYAGLEESALSDMKEKDDFPDRHDQFIGNMEQGVNNGTGWLVQGFIEDKSGALRPQSFEETVFCIGCHGGIGATTDSVFSFARKLPSTRADKGWGLQTAADLHNLPEPRVELKGAGVFYEYSYYLMYNRSGNEFRDNPEVIARFFNQDGSVKKSAMQTLHDDVSSLLLPSPERARDLNKAYRTIVEDQDFVLGRDANFAPIQTVHRELKEDEPTGLDKSTSIVRLGSQYGSALDYHYVQRLSHPKLRPPQPLFGNGTGGPDGAAYEANWAGEILKSRYASSIAGARMDFPNRLTLPTRPIVPTDGNPSCMICHREIHGLTAEQPGRLGEGRNAAVSPDGKKIAFVDSRSGTDQIYLMDTDGTHVQQISSATMAHNWPAWKADSSAVVFVGYDDNRTNFIIASYSLTAQKEEIRVRNSDRIEKPVFHPTENMIAYSALKDGNWDLWLWRPEGEIRLTSSQDMESSPYWRPDGRALAYKLAPTSGKYPMTTENVFTFENGLDKPTMYEWDGAQGVQLNDWSPDGSHMTYTEEIISSGSGKDHVSYGAMVSDVKLEDGKVKISNTRLLSQGLTMGDRGPVFSPKGSEILFFAWNRNYQERIWLYNLDTGNLGQLLLAGDVRYPKWSHDGTSVMFESRNGNKTRLHLLKMVDIDQQVQVAKTE